MLMYGPADGWVLLDDHTGDAVDTWVAGPELLTEAQQWAAGRLADSHTTVTSWQEAPGTGTNPTSRQYLAMTSPGPSPTTDDPDPSNTARPEATDPTTIPDDSEIQTNRAAG